MVRLICSLILVLTLTGCVGFNNFLFGTPEQREARIRAEKEAMVPLAQFHAPYDIAFRSTIRSLVDNGFEVKKSDAGTGLITAVLRQDQAGSRERYAYLNLWGMNASDPTVKDYAIVIEQRLSILVDKINDGVTEIKIESNQRRYVEAVNGQIKERELTWNEGISNKMIFDMITFEIGRRQTAS